MFHHFLITIMLEVNISFLPERCEANFAKKKDLLKIAVL